MRLLINAFIIVHILLISAWLFPINPSMLAIKSIFSHYIIFLGLDQNYAMFAPDVRKTNRHLFALITFHDLSTLLWLYPRIERMSILEAIQKERYRKFANDNIVAPCFKMFLPDFARYIARLQACCHNQPELVSLYLSETAIPQPEQESIAIPLGKLTNIFTYQVEQGDLIRN